MAQQILNGLVLGSILLLFSLGLSLAWGTLDVLNLAHGAIFIFGGYLGYAVSVSTGLPFLAVAALAVIGSGALAALLEVVAFGQIRRRMTNTRQAELAVLVASLGASIAINQAISNTVKNSLFAPSARLLEVHGYQFWGLRITNVAILILATAAVMAVLLAYWIRASRQGRATRAIACAPGTAALMGINVRWLRLQVMFISGALAGLAGFLLSFHVSGEDVSTGGVYMLSAFAILVFGGVGSLLGATIAAYLVAMAETMVIAFGPSGYSSGVAFLLIFVMLLVRPQGLIPRGRSARA